MRKGRWSMMFQLEGTPCKKTQGEHVRVNPLGLITAPLHGVHISLRVDHIWGGRKETGRGKNKEEIHWGETEAFLPGKTETISAMPKETFRLSLTPALIMARILKLKVRNNLNYWWHLWVAEVAHIHIYVLYPDSIFMGKMLLSFNYLFISL